MVLKQTEFNSQAQNTAKNFLNDTLKELMAVFKAECGSLFLFDRRNKELILDSFYNSKNLPVNGVRRKLGEGVSGKVIAERLPVLVKDIDVDSRFSRNGYKHYHTNSFMSIPLTGPDGVIGLINIADKSNLEPFTEQDLDFAATLVRYSSIVAYNLSLADKLQQEKELLDKQKRLLEQYASVGKLAAGVVHEVNNPLDGIIRFTNILLNHIENNSVTREYLLEIKKGLHRIENITRSLLQFSHQVNSSFHKPKDYIDLHQLIDESLNVFEARINDVRIVKHFNLTKTRVIDLGLLHVFINIIKNSLDSMADKGSLEIYTRMNESYVQISFKDSGAGIPEEIKNRIFDPFFTTKNMDEGTGLGLSICKEIVNRYSGKIEVDSAPGAGSTFEIFLPVKFLENV